MEWSPEQYLRFAKQRAEPFVDLVALIDKRPSLSFLDLGCGTGDLTRQLADQLLDSRGLGIDSSAEMLARAAQHAGKGLSFAQSRIEDLVDTDGPHDLVFSHAAIHWVDDHEALIPRLVGLLAAKGQLAVQLPSNHDHFSHRVLGDVAGFRRDVPVLPVERYVELLYAAGAREIVAFEKVYPHELPDAAAILEWVKGTACLPYLSKLPPSDHAAFLLEVHRRLNARFPGSPILYPFKRIFFSARRR